MVIFIYIFFLKENTNKSPKCFINLKEFLSQVSKMWTTHLHKCEEGSPGFFFYPIAWSRYKCEKQPIKCFYLPNIKCSLSLKNYKHGMNANTCLLLWVYDTSLLLLLQLRLLKKFLEGLNLPMTLYTANKVVKLPWKCLFMTRNKEFYGQNSCLLTLIEYHKWRIQGLIFKSDSFNHNLPLAQSDSCTICRQN